MKAIKKLSAVLALIMVAIFSSCSNSSDGGGGGTAALGTLKANIGGANFTSISQGTTAVDAFNGTYHNFSISGVDASGK